MEIKRILYLLYCEDITEIEHSNIDVTVELKDGSRYVVIIATPSNLEYLMNKDKMNYLEIGYPIIIVKQLTKAIIVEAIKAYVKESDGYWLKLHHFAGNIDKTVFDSLEAKAKELDKLYEDKELRELDDTELKKIYEVYEFE
jgi:hypothetical protein